MSLQCRAATAPVSQLPLCWQGAQPSCNYSSRGSGDDYWLPYSMSFDRLALYWKVIKMPFIFNVDFALQIAPKYQNCILGCRKLGFIKRLCVHASSNLATSAGFGLPLLLPWLAYRGYAKGGEQTSRWDPSMKIWRFCLTILCNCSRNHSGLNAKGYFWLLYWLFFWRAILTILRLCLVSFYKRRCLSSA
jgi:hypothetical protein